LGGEKNADSENGKLKKGGKEKGKRKGATSRFVISLKKGKGRIVSSTVLYLRVWKSNRGTIFEKRGKRKGGK